METAATFVGKMESKFQGWGAQLDQMVGKAKEASAEVTAEHQKLVEDLKAKHASAQAKLAEFKASGSENWDTFKAGAEAAWQELEAAFEKLTH